jgi:SSS family solute:Na+ symporter
VIFRLARVGEGVDETIPADYFADAGDPRVEKIQLGAHETTPSA